MRDSLLSIRRRWPILALVLLVALAGFFYDSPREIESCGSTLSDAQSFQVEEMERLVRSEAPTELSLEFEPVSRGSCVQPVLNVRANTSEIGPEKVPELLAWSSSTAESSRRGFWRIDMTITADVLGQRTVFNDASPSDWLATEQAHSALAGKAKIVNVSTHKKLFVEFDKLSETELTDIQQSLGGVEATEMRFHSGEMSVENPRVDVSVSGFEPKFDSLKALLSVLTPEAKVVDIFYATGTDSFVLRTSGGQSEVDAIKRVFPHNNLVIKTGS